MTVIEFKVRIEMVQAKGAKVILHLKPFTNQVPISPKILQFEDIIVNEPKTEEEKIAKRLVKTYVQEFQKRGLLPSSKQQPVGQGTFPLKIELSEKEYDRLGKPTVNELLTLKLEYTPTTKS